MLQSSLVSRQSRPAVGHKPVAAPKVKMRQAMLPQGATKPAPNHIHCRHMAVVPNLACHMNGGVEILELLAGLHVPFAMNGRTPLFASPGQQVLVTLNGLVSFRLARAGWRSHLKILRHLRDPKSCLAGSAKACHNHSVRNLQGCHGQRWQEEPQKALCLLQLLQRLQRLVGGQQTVEVACLVFADLLCLSRSRPLSHVLPL